MELIINPVDLIYRLFITELRFRKGQSDDPAANF